MEPNTFTEQTTDSSSDNRSRFRAHQTTSNLESPSKTLMTLPSTKSDLGSKNPIRSDLIVISELGEPEARVMYQAYRLGSLPEGWRVKKDLKPLDFIEVIDGFIQATYSYGWSVRDEEQPLVMVFGKDVDRFIVMGDVIWWPKISKRRKVDAIAALLNEVRKSRVGLIEAEYKDKKFYELLMKFKILRRVGSLYDTIDKNSRTTLFQTRAI